jgi:hypothetical protein
MKRGIFGFSIEKLFLKVYCLFESHSYKTFEDHAYENIFYRVQWNLCDTLIP